MANKKAIFKITPDGYSHFVAVPGVIQWVPAGPKAVGGTWTGVMVLTYMFALMGIQASPAFSMWAFANNIVSFFIQPDKQELDRRMVFHNFLREHARLPEDKRHLIKFGWIITIIWFLFAIGPFCVIGNTIFGNPLQPSTWPNGMPSIWIWQILWWILGIGMMWFLAYKLEMSTNITTEFEALKHDIYEEVPVIGEEDSRGMSSP